jgi:hypothetical protein
MARPDSPGIAANDSADALVVRNSLRFIVTLPQPK